MHRTLVNLILCLGMLCSFVGLTGCKSGGTPLQFTWSLTLGQTEQAFSSSVKSAGTQVSSQRDRSELSDIAVLMTAGEELCKKSPRCSAIEYVGIARVGSYDEVTEIAIQIRDQNGTIIQKDDQLFKTTSIRVATMNKMVGEGKYVPLNQ